MYIAVNTPLGMVTILILIDGFLQFNTYNVVRQALAGHNPYFNRWFSAIQIII